MTSRKQRAEQNRIRKEHNKAEIARMKSFLQSFCGLGGEYSAAEIVLVSASRLNYTVNATIHPHQHIKNLYKKAESQSEKKLSTFKTKKDFYSSRLWKIARYQAFESYGNKCQCCGAMPPDVVLHVDHIKPRSTHPEPELDISNLQILREDCNSGKINQWDTSWIGSC